MTIIRRDPSKIFNRIVEHKGVVYLCGLTAEDKSQPIKAQTENVLARIDQLLAAGGTDKTKLLTATIYITDMSLKPAMNEAWTAWSNPDIFPTRACVAVGLDGGALVEIVVTAAK